MSISGYSWTEERAEKYNLSDYYFAGENETEQVLITLASNGKKYKDAASVDGLKVGAQVASLQADMVTKQLPNATLVTYADINTGLMMLKNGDFDCMAVAIGNANSLISKNPDVAMSGFQFVVSDAEANNLILMQKGDDELTAKVNAALAKALAAGMYEVWYEEALNTAGVEISYDANGNPITTGADDTTEAE
jgi:polar amino acid transport system substrate-binding protein